MDATASALPAAAGTVLSVSAVFVPAGEAIPNSAPAAAADGFVPEGGVYILAVFAIPAAAGAASAAGAVPAGESPRVEPAIPSAGSVNAGGTAADLARTWASLLISTALSFVVVATAIMTSAQSTWSSARRMVACNVLLYGILGGIVSCWLLLCLTEKPDVMSRIKGLLVWNLFLTIIALSLFGELSTGLRIVSVLGCVFTWIAVVFTATGMLKDFSRWIVSGLKAQLHQE